MEKEQNSKINWKDNFPKENRYFETENGILYCGDNRNILSKIKDNSVDLIFTSPPYEDISGAGYKANKKDVLFLKLYSEYLDNILNNLYRILNEKGQFYFNIKHKTMNKQLRTVHWIEFLESFQNFILKSYIIWKYAGSFDSTNKRFHLDYEIIYHLSKTDNIILNIDVDIHDSLSSVWYIPHNIKNRLHPTQMPEKVVERGVLLSSKENQIILEPFAGSGTTLIIAEKLNRKWIGIELNKEYCEIIKKRFLNEQKQSRLF